MMIRWWFHDLHHHHHHHHDQQQHHPQELTFGVLCFGTVFGFVRNFFRSFLRRGSKLRKTRRRKRLLNTNTRQWTHRTKNMTSKTPHISKHSAVTTNFLMCRLKHSKRLLLRNRPRSVRARQTLLVRSLWDMVTHDLNQIDFWQMKQTLDIAWHRLASLDIAWHRLTSLDEMNLIQFEDSLMMFVQYSDTL